MSKPTLGEVVLVRELEATREPDNEGVLQPAVKVKRTTAAIVTAVAPDDTVEVLAFHSGGRLTPIGGLTVHDADQLPPVADFKDPDKPDPAGLCAYRPAATPAA